MDLSSEQLSKLQALLAELRKGNEFYRSRMEAAGVDESIDSLDEFSEKMPFTTKMDLVWDREESPPYGTNLTYPVGRYSRLCQSSGTTRGPLPWLDTEESWSAMLDCWDRVYEAAEIGPDQAIFFAFSFGPFLGFWTAFESATRRGNLSIPGGGLSSLARLQAMATHRARVLCCTPTYALRLGELLEERQGDDEILAKVAIEKIVVAGEPGGSIPEVRERLAELWNGARVFDHHGMTEVGPVTYEHAEKPLSLCVIEEAYLAEVIDRETHREVADGEKGELVLTTLTRTACPLLRYRTGDLVEKSSFDGKLCLEGGILGRVDDMVVIRGVNIYPTAVEKVIRGFSEVAEFQVKQTTRQSMAELEVTIEPYEKSTHDSLAERVGRALQDAFTLRIPVHVVDSGALPRFEFKSKRWVKESDS
ncbi:MAG: AMP-binding protein [Verrucomicrobiales bacterium]|nr:AMP-binding protein [Verrucomicrobiales bacterium]